MAKEQPVGPYGRLELQSKYHRFFSYGLAVAALFHFLGVGSYYLALELQRMDEDNIPMVRMMKYTEMGPPPSITNTEIAPAVAVASARPTVGIPVPVPDADVAPEATIASQTELSQQVSNIPEISGEGTQIEIEQDIRIDHSEDPDMDAFIPVEKLPEAIKQPQPKYPELAQRAGLEGTVWVRILVEKDGKPKKAVIQKSDADVFNDSAVEAAMNSLFTPAVMNNGPIACWVSVPYKFKLK